MVGSWFGYLLLGRWMRRSGFPDSPAFRWAVVDRCSGCIVGSATYALKRDATNLRECGAKGTGTRRSGRAGTAGARGRLGYEARGRPLPPPRRGTHSSNRGAHLLIDGAEYRAALRI